MSQRQVTSARMIALYLADKNGILDVNQANQQDLANILGVTRATVGKMIQRLGAMESLIDEFIVGMTTQKIGVTKKRNEELYGQKESEENGNGSDVDGVK